MKNNSEVQNFRPKVCLTVAGLDPSGGAGIVADIKTFTAFGCFATAAVASVTFQNTGGVFGAVHQTAQSMRGQIQPLVEDFEIAALKTGMLPDKEVIEETARIIEENDLKNLVVDPVIRSTSGFDLIDAAALRSLIEKLFPLALVVTPNLPEAERIAGIKIENEADVRRAARIIQSLGAKNVLIKGGHFFSDERGTLNAESEAATRIETQNLKFAEPRTAKDYLFAGDRLHVFEAEYIETSRTHGTGCTLAAAIAANLALGNDLIRSIETAKRFVTEAIRTAPDLGKGHSPINHTISDFRF